MRNIKQFRSVFRIKLPIRSSMATLALQRSWWQPIPVVLLCFGMGLSSSWMLYREMNATTEATGPQVGTLESAQHSVRRKPATSFLWAQVAPGALLSRRDAVQVGTGGSATIRLMDGSSVELGENSLVVLEDSRDMALSFLQGSFVVRKGATDTLLRVEKGKTKSEVLRVRLLRPLPQQVVFTSGAIQPNAFEFEWVPSSKGITENQAVQISSRRSFSPETTRTFPMDLNAKRMTHALGAGSYYWRLVSGTTPLSETRSFKVVPAKALQPSAPSENEKLTTWSKGGRIPFSWDVVRSEGVVPDTIPTHLEISEKADFSTLKFQTRVAPSASMAWLDAVPPGDYYWRLTSRYPGVTVSSRGIRFRLASAPKLTIDLQNPKAGTTFKRNEPISFQWSLDGLRATYRLEIEPFDKRSETVRLESITPNSKWISKVPSSYRWRVLGYIDGNTVGESIWQRFDVTEASPLILKLPTANSSLQYWKAPAAFEYRWESAGQLDDGSYYQLELASDSAFASAVKVHQTTETVVSSAVLPPIEGTTFWRVRLLNSSGGALRVSPVYRFEHGPFPKLRAPASVQPAADYAFAPKKVTDVLALQWEPVKDAVSYVVTVMREGKKFRSLETKSEKAILKGLAPGKYTWAVKAVDALHREGESIPARKLSILAPKKLRAPSLRLR